MSRERISNRRETPKPRVWPLVVLAVFSFAVAIGIGVLGEHYPSVEKHSTFILAVVAALLAFELGELHNRYSVSEQLIRIQDGQQATLENIERLRASSEAAAIFSSFANPGWNEYLPRMAGLAHTIDSAWSATAIEGQLLNWKRSSVLSTAFSSFETLADGDLVIDDPAKELITNLEFLHQLCKHRLRAVSYQDEGFWNSDAGEDFLRGHATAIGNHVSIERIFIVARGAEQQINAILHKQKSVGISVRIAYKEALVAKHSDCIEDFVLYDDAYVRFGRLRNFAVSSLDKDATLSKNDNTVNQFANRYQVLKSVSHAI